MQVLEPHTVKPVLSGPVLSGHPLLSGQLSKSRKLLPLITVILTSIKRSRSHFTKSQQAVSIVLTCIKRSLCKRKPLKYYSRNTTRDKLLGCEEDEADDEVMVVSA